MAAKPDDVTIEMDRTPLAMACIRGHTKIVELLLKKGANVNVTDENENTPLGIACKKGHTEIVELLLKHGIDNTNSTMNDKNCIPGTASAEGQQPQRVNINHTNLENRTALHIACDEGCKEIVELLLKHNGVDINITDKDSNTPLISACIKGHTEIVKLLLKHGANVTKCDEKGLNALDIAVEEGKKGAAMAIVKSDKWKEALCSYTEVDTSDESADKICGIRRICCCKKRKSHEAKKQFTTPMRRIIKKMPDVAKVVFENCCKEDNPPDHPDHEITFNYEFLDDFDEPKLEGDPSSDSTTQNTGNDDNDEQPGAKRSYEKWPPKAKYSSENHCLNILADSPSADLLKHPLAATLLDQKWNKIGRIVYYTNLFFYFLFVILLTSYALTVHPPNSNICMEVFGNDNETSIDCFTGNCRIITIM
ncbi:PREDICTED: transient receptor potential cation channel subfamily A member 1 homolog [Amphimedon queenslandica]|uniref:Ion transport domain-containing protein n=1 Tax=Amphimedon queenslandica TaxID=400682 RepID=A0AAN0JNQ0_AMPQE|nr:PREDICTED: transient receptor potential cation channel subfamily A member 1 homolog [Amphimedon queenslandica]|eukprot:XP_019858662.1 PREDICTED: transient receptor potential cation channel subfamily A member 1 homolog [Amphimedon queenslandica]